MNTLTILAVTAAVVVFMFNIAVLLFGVTFGGTTTAIVLIVGVIAVAYLLAREDGLW